MVNNLAGVFKFLILRNNFLYPHKFLSFAFIKFKFSLTKQI